MRRSTVEELEGKITHLLSTYPFGDKCFLTKDADGHYFTITKEETIEELCEFVQEAWFNEHVSQVTEIDNLVKNNPPLITEPSPSEAQQLNFDFWAGCAAAPGGPNDYDDIPISMTVGLYASLIEYRNTEQKVS